YTTTQTHTLTLHDALPILFTNAPADASVDCGAIPAVPTVTATDNCDSEVTVTFDGETNNVVDGCGTIERTWTATDACGNTATHTQIITVTDTEDPVFTNAPADASVDCVAIPAVPTVTATDNCDSEVTVTFDGETNNVVDGCRTIERTWTATDACGNTATHTQIIKVTDTEDPVFTNAPADASVDCVAIPAVPTVTATDNCDSEVTVTFDGETNNVVDGCGTIERTWTATDACGNTATHTQII